MRKVIYILYIVCFTLLLMGCGVDQAVKKGDKFWAVGEYYDAAEQYKKAYSQTPSKERTTRGQRAKKLAECYRRLNQTNKAISAYNNVIRYKQADSLTHLYLGQLYMRNGNYKEAAKQFAVAIDSLEVRDESEEVRGLLQLAKTGLESSQKAPQWKKEGSAYTIKKMDLFNSRRDDYSPMLSGDSDDQLYFTSTRNQAQGDELSGITGAKNADIFYVQKDEKGKWGKPQVIASELNSVYDEGACCFSPDGKTMYLTQCATDPDYPRYAKIMVSTRNDASWSKPKELVIARDTLSSFAHPAVSPDGEWLYFVSDMAGGMGGLDIWRCRLESSTEVSYAENVGAPINTPGDEMFPTFRPNGDLYFSSNGHPGLGGLDIYYISHPTPEPSPIKGGENVEVAHPGWPLNSQGDDFGMTFEGKLNQGFFCSNRGDLRGFDHIYSFYNPEVIQTVKGWVYEQDGYELTAAQVYMVGNDGTNIKLSVRSDGSFTQEIKPNVDYVILGTCKGFLNHQEQIRVEPTKKSEEYVLQFPLANISAPVLIENIFYDFNKATLRPESKQALDELVQLLNENPNITIELSAHTDCRGSEAYNEQLSQRRAESVVAYLIAHGIAADRLTPKGYGESNPKRIKKRVAEKYEFLKEGDVLTEEMISALPEELQEQYHQMNRRTEFKVLRTTYGLFDKAGKLVQSPAAAPQPKD
ncbi:OmpA family protein [Xylanibacter ruminicola]|uniref:Outer membrane protein OmpA n=1 Tax=Xylanibacter ruminicola TaxID=839 RepID=A0A1M6YSX3_XYLRU|nr:OmpA family protein [Xylanibacter ruminicola]SHL21205.1 Outer membrane protein OmpA [Xylanibacter ruminicola]